MCNFLTQKAADNIEMLPYQILSLLDVGNLLEDNKILGVIR